MTRHFKLGLFAIAVTASIALAAFGLGMHRRVATTTFHTYFDESVQGLDVGSPVKYRGVKIGSVERIEIAPDHKRVEVSLALAERDIDRLGLADTAPDIRTELDSQGITGVKFIDIDFVDPAAESPPPKLPFLPEHPYIPARASLFKGLQDNLEIVGHHLPQLVVKLEAVLDDVRDEHVPRKIANTLEGIDQGVAEVRTLLRDITRERVPARASALLARLERDGGLLASAERAATSLGDLGVALRGSPGQLDRTLRELGEAAIAFRELVDTIDRDPDMLIKGRARTAKP
jgi:phospholipid/cholesterol/gamma-HCH transport system substrate-binding protein